MICSINHGKKSCYKLNYRIKWYFIPVHISECVGGDLLELRGHVIDVRIPYYIPMIMMIMMIKWITIMIRTIT